jgi:tRNA(Leu) C34 or U34 (ribose-2'-O)-methylase TrmL
MRLYNDVTVFTGTRESLVDELANGYRLLTPIAVEVRPNAERLPDFEHPLNALYVFGPEDGTLDRGILEACHRFVVIPSTNCLNLAAAVNVVLYDRMAKSGQRPVPRDTTAYANVEG